jgi:long-chain acyl-CoA synthetase
MTTIAPTASAHHWGSEVVETEVLGHPCLTFAKRRRNITELLIDGRRFGKREYVIQGETRLTFEEHERAVRTGAALLRDKGVGPGDRVMLLGPNSLDWVVSFWSVLYVGGVVVLGNAWWSESELAHSLAISDPRLVLTDSARREMVPAHRAVATFDLLRAYKEETQDPATPVAEDDPAIILFTSGTTGLPKGATLSHRGTIATLQSLVVRTRRLPTEDAPLPPVSKALLSLPLFHIGGLQQVLNPMVAGGSLVFTVGKFDAGAVVRLIEDEQIKVWSAVPTMASRVVQHLEASGHGPIHVLKTLGLGGSPVPQQLRQSVTNYFPDAERGLAVTYGLSEAGGVVTTGAGAEIRDRPGTVGRPLATTQLRVDAPDENGVGEILVRSPSIMLGYWPASASVDGDEAGISRERWLRTGDIGWIDTEGYLYITDRSKDIVIRGGENIATPHVENRLLEHPDVREAAVVGLPHPTLGEELGAVVVLKDEAEPDEKRLAAFVRERLAYFEVPTQWWFHPGPLPQNTTGKVVKRLLGHEWSDRLVNDKDDAS